MLRRQQERNTMGLDMYAFTTVEDIPATDFEIGNECQELFYWRKHPNLHGWMERLYLSKGGNNPEFNCAQLRLDEADLNALETSISNDALPETSGFFFGQSLAEEEIRDLEFLTKAREALARGDRVFYTSWW